MTAIVAYRHGEAAFLLGDFALSGMPLSEPLSLPSRWSAAQPSANPAFNGLAQKVVQVDDRCAVAWSGREIYAKAVIGDVRDRILAGARDFTIGDVIADFDFHRHEHDRLSFVMFMIRRDPNRLVRSTWNVGTRTYADGRELYFAGSGGTHVLKYLDHGYTLLSGPRNTIEDARRAIITQAAGAFRADLATDANHALGYGGGFEVIEADGAAMVIRKRPIGAVVWTYEGEDFDPRGPFFLQSYSEDGALVVDRCEVGGLIHRHLIDGLIRKPNPSRLPPLNTLPYAYVHYLEDATGRSPGRAVVVSGEEPGQGFRIYHDIERERIGCEYDTTFLERVLLQPLRAA